MQKRLVQIVVIALFLSAKLYAESVISKTYDFPITNIQPEEISDTLISKSYRIPTVKYRNDDVKKNMENLLNFILDSEPTVTPLSLQTLEMGDEMVLAISSVDLEDILWNQKFCGVIYHQHESTEIPIFISRYQPAIWGFTPTWKILQNVTDTTMLNSAIFERCDSEIEFNLNKYKPKQKIYTVYDCIDTVWLGTYNQRSNIVTMILFSSYRMQACDKNKLSKLKTDLRKTY